MIDFNRPGTWADAEIHTPPTAVDVPGYQNKIDQICGFTPEGKSAVILVWMPDIGNYSRYFCDWDIAGFGIKTHLRGTYKYTTLYDPAGNPIDIPPPRWALKQWQSAIQYLATDEISRWQRAESGQQVRLRETRPAHPKDGRYIPLMRIGKHDSSCCKQAKEDQSICYGDYRTPDDAYLEVLRKVVKLRSDEQGQSPNEPISEKTLMQAAREAAEIEEKKKRATKEFISDVVNEYAGEWLGAMTGEGPTTAYSIPTKKLESGILIPV